MVSDEWFNWAKAFPSPLLGPTPLSVSDIHRHQTRLGGGGWGGCCWVWQQNAKTKKCCNLKNKNERFFAFPPWPNFPGRMGGGGWGFIKLCNYCCRMPRPRQTLTHVITNLWLYVIYENTKIQSTHRSLQACKITKARCERSGVPKTADTLSVVKIIIIK